MPQTYDQISSTIVSGSSASSILFNSIPQTYTDLVLVVYIVPTASTKNFIVQANGVTATTYPQIGFYNNSTTTMASQSGNQAGYFLNLFSTSGSRPLLGSVNILNYTNTSNRKTALCEFSQPLTGVQFTTSHVDSTSAITSLTIKATDDSSIFDVNTTATLYGILRA